MAAGGDNYITYTYRGGERHDIPHDATHIIIAKSVSVIPEDAFRGHPNIVEVICDVNVKGVGREAFAFCPCLRRLIMPGVEIVARSAFNNCEALTDVQCGKLEIIEAYTFGHCTSLMSIDLPSARIVEWKVFYCCEALTDVKFDSKLDRIEGEAFCYCEVLERITIPLKDDMITHDIIFIGCENLKHVDLAEGPIHETIAALPLEEWRNDMSEEIDTINQILPTASAGGYGVGVGDKARAIRTWIRSVLDKIISYKAQYQRLLDEAATSLQLALPRDIVMNNILPFLELSSYTLEFEDEEEEEEGDDDDGRRYVTIWRRWCCC